MCIGKHINYRLEWDELTPMATAYYNFFPNCSARESTFFVMFGRDPINKLNILLHAARRYFHDDNGLPNLGGSTAASEWQGTLREETSQPTTK